MALARVRGEGLRRPSAGFRREPVEIIRKTSRLSLTSPSSPSSVMFFAWIVLCEREGHWPSKEPVAPAWLALKMIGDIRYSHQNRENTFLISFSICAATLFSAIDAEFGWPQALRSIRHSFWSICLT